MLETRPHTDPHLAEWQSIITTTVASVVQPGNPVALVNFPNHGNVGDDAIWLGTLRVLRQLECPVAYMSSPQSYSGSALRSTVPDGPILINGGGNFGDLYAPQQRVRERILAEQIGLPIVQLPQSIHFQDDANLRRMKELVAAHGGVTIMAREDRSLAIARGFDAQVITCPDMALALGPLQRPRPADSDVLWLLRDAGSPEYVDPGPRPDRDGWHTTEWRETLDIDQAAWPDADRAILARNCAIRQRCLESDVSAQFEWEALADTFEPLAEAWVRRGLQILSRGRVVITERLHGHLLCLLLGIPHVVLDSSYGKSRATMRTWTGGHPLAHEASDAASAADLAARLLESLEDARTST